MPTLEEQQTADYAALALLEAQFNSRRNETADSIIGDANHIETARMLASAIHMCTNLTKALADTIDQPPQNVVQLLREWIEDSYQEGTQE